MYSYGPTAALLPMHSDYWSAILSQGNFIYFYVDFLE